MADIPDKKTISKYLKAVRLAAESPEPGEVQAAKTAVKGLIDKYPNLPFYAASQAAEAMAAEKLKDVERAATAAGVQATGVKPGGILDGLLARTSEILGKKLNLIMDNTTSELVAGLEGFVDESFRDSFLPSNAYLSGGSITDHLDELAESFDEDHECPNCGGRPACLAIEEDEDGEEFLRVELSFPLELIEAIFAREHFKVEFTNWLFEGLLDEDDNTEEEEIGDAYEL